MDNFKTIKIYWVATVSTKWQIILPAESREDFKIENQKEFFIQSLWTQKENKEYIGFAIYENKEIVDCLKQKTDIKNIFFESENFVKIWTKFQFVIPSQIRNSLEISPWNSLIVVWKKWHGIGFIKNDRINYLFEFIKKNLT